MQSIVSWVYYACHFVNEKSDEATHTHDEATLETVGRKDPAQMFDETRRFALVQSHTVVMRCIESVSPCNVLAGQSISQSVE